jgi:hypothetical protein
MHEGDNPSFWDEFINLLFSWQIFLSTEVRTDWAVETLGDLQSTSRGLDPGVNNTVSCHTYCDTEPPFLRSYLKDQRFSLLNAMLLAKEQSLPILNVSARVGLELTTSRLLIESTTSTTLRVLGV